MKRPYYMENEITLYHGDCLTIMKAHQPNSIDTIVTDPPYHLTTGKKGGRGVASEELAHVTRHSLVAISPRLRPLANEGRIYAGSKRKNLSGRLAIVWFAAQTQPTLF